MELVRYQKSGREFIMTSERGGKTNESDREKKWSIYEAKVQLESDVETKISINNVGAGSVKTFVSLEINGSFLVRITI